jgi:hypothetical protein
MMFGTPLFWRETHKPGKFLMFEGRVVIVLLLMVMHIRPWTIALAFMVMGVLYFFQRKGVSADSILRYLRARLVGRRRTARGVHNRRVPVDFHFEARLMRQRPAPAVPGPSSTPVGRTGLLSRLGLGRAAGPRTAHKGKGGRPDV